MYARPPLTLPASYYAIKLATITAMCSVKSKSTVSVKFPFYSHNKI